MAKVTLTSRWTIAAGTVLLAVYGAAFHLKKSHDREKSRLISESMDRVERVRISRPGTVVELVRDNGRFVFVTPFPGVEADPKAFKRFLTFVEKIPARRRWTEEGDLSRFGVEPDSPRLTLTLGDQERVYVQGRRSPVKDEVFVHVPHRGEIVLIPQTAGLVFSVVGLDFRQRRLFPPGKITGWELRRPGRPALKVSKEGPLWHVSQGGPLSTPCDRSLARAMAGTIEALQVTDFEPVDKRLTPADTGLDAPSAGLTVTFATGPAVVLDFGTARSSYTAVAVNGVIAGGVDPAFLGSMPANEGVLQKKSLMDFPMDSVARIVIRRDDVQTVYERQRGKWVQLGRDLRKADPRILLALVNGLRKAAIKEFLPGNPTEAVSREYGFYDDDGDPLLEMWIGPKSGATYRAGLKGDTAAFLMEASVVETL